MVLYFSGTGNSRYVAEFIAEIIDDELVSINKMLKSEKKEASLFDTKKPLVFVLPTYAWRIPVKVEEFIRESKFQGNCNAYFVLTCGKNTGNACGYIKKLCRDKGFLYKGMSQVVMPDNYIVMSGVKNTDEADKIIREALPSIRIIAEDIKSGNKLDEPKLYFGARIESAIINPIFNKGNVAKGFYATDACISCGQCEDVCPLNNISLKDGKPQWREDCMQCLGCINICPKGAIEYKKSTKGKMRYYNRKIPEV